MKTYDVAIIGGGFQGLFLAYQLSKKGKKVIVIEKENQLGGLLSGLKIGNTYVEKYYHHLFTEDNEIKNLLTELSLNKDLKYKKTSSGFYYKDKIYEMKGPIDLLFFKPLRFKEKIQFIFLMLKIIRANPKNLDNIGAKQWLIKNSSISLYKKMFEPLIISKFGKERLDDVSASWLVGRIKLRSRSKGKGESLGYLENGFQQLIERLTSEIKKNNSEIIKTKFLKFQVKKNEIQSAICKNKIIKAKKYISTLKPQFTFKNLKLPKQYEEKLKATEYQGTVCLLLGIKNKLSNTYWTNIISEKDLPFKAIIEHTNFQDKSKYGLNLVYLSGYYPLNSNIWKEKEQEIINNYIKNLKELFPVKEEEILFKKLFRDKHTGIISKKDFLKNLLPFITPIKNLFIIGMFNTYPERGLELQARLGKKLIGILK